MSDQDGIEFACMYDWIEERRAEERRANDMLRELIEITGETPENEWDRVRRMAAMTSISITNTLYLRISYNIRIANQRRKQNNTP